MAPLFASVRHQRLARSFQIRSIPRYQAGGRYTLPTTWNQFSGRFHEGFGGSHYSVLRIFRARWPTSSHSDVRPLERVASALDFTTSLPVNQRIQIGDVGRCDSRNRAAAGALGIDEQPSVKRPEMVGAVHSGECRRSPGVHALLGLPGHGCKRRQEVRSVCTRLRRHARQAAIICVSSSNGNAERLFAQHVFCRPARRRSSFARGRRLAEQIETASTSSSANSS